MPHRLTLVTTRQLPYVGLLLVAACVHPGPVPETGELAAAGLCVTEGHLDGEPDGRMSVNVPKMRAYANGNAADLAELRFTYLGATESREALASGLMREQFGLKLRAQDPCNLVYVMWHLEPKPGLFVSLKSNPDQHSSAECGNHGYRDIKPQVSADLPSLQPGDAHRLRGEIHGQELRAFVDERLVWQGSLDATAADLRGPAGVRSDNAHLEFELAVKGASEPASSAGGVCARVKEAADD